MLLTSSGHGSFRLWDAATGRPLGPPAPAATPAQAARPSCFALSADGRTVLAGHADGAAQAWDAATGRRLGAPALQAGAVCGVAFAADDRSFLTVSPAGVIRHWPLPAPLAGTPRRITESVRLATGMRLDEGRAVVAMKRPEWQALRADWRRREGESDWAIAPGE